MISLPRKTDTKEHRADFVYLGHRASYVDLSASYRGLAWRLLMLVESRRPLQPNSRVTMCLRKIQANTIYTIWTRATRANAKGSVNSHKMRHVLRFMIANIKYSDVVLSLDPWPVCSFE